VSDGIGELLARNLRSREREKLLVIRNGIDELLPVRASLPQERPLRIVYVGTFYFNRDPFPFLRALSQSKGSGSRFQLELVGRCRWFAGRSVEKSIEDLGLTDIVVFRDWVPHAECQRIIREADVLLLLAQGQPAQIPNKLYEYLGTRIPILAFVDQDGESARMLQAARGHVVVHGTSDEEARKAIESALDLAARGAVSGSEATLQEWTTEAQMERLMDSIEGGMSSGKDGPLRESSATGRPKYSDS
jgi:glycosyltransferase involved in cell wall biosynthesis